jgi:RibD C-terminal domain
LSKIVAGITTSVDGYITGPNDGPGCGLGVGGERLHYWVFGGPWSYDSPGRGEASGEAKAIRQALAAGYVDELTVIVAPVVLGGGKRLFDGFSQLLDLEHLWVRQSPYATFIHYRVK